MSTIPDSVFEKKNLTVGMIGLEGYTLYPPLSAMGDSDIHSIPLKEIPERIGELTQLKILQVYGSRITKLPSSITQLKKLEKLDVSMSPLLNIMAELDQLKQLPNLRVLNIFAVNISDTDLLIFRKTLGRKVHIIFSLAEFEKERKK